MLVKIKVWTYLAQVRGPEEIQRGKWPRRKALWSRLC